MKNQPSDAILADFLTKTGAVLIAPTEQEEADMREVEERKAKATVDREVMRTYLEKQRREAARIAQARNEAAAVKQID